ncbi:MAG: sulfotransferase family 2 domain-containing protein [Phycisphaeraceae bacterium]|nr:sulfotransferase family 2 domain-containing protein [Phycisphaeraceae bacterium]
MTRSALATDQSHSPPDRRRFVPPLVEQENRAFPRSYYLVLPAQRAFICAMPKSGCTTIKRWLLAAIDPGAADVADAHTYCRRTHSLANLAEPAARECLDTYLGAVFLREPIDRIVSAFTEKFVCGATLGCFHPAREAMEAMARIAGVDVRLDTTAKIGHPDRPSIVPASTAVDYARGVTFREFVRFLSDCDDSQLDSHWRPQNAFIAGQTFAFAGRVEHLSTALPGLAAHLNLPAPATLRHNAVRYSPWDGACLADVPSGEIRRRGITPTAEALLDDETRQLLTRRLAADIDAYQRTRAAPGFDLDSQPVRF